MWTHVANVHLTTLPNQSKVYNDFPEFINWYIPEQGKMEVGSGMTSTPPPPPQKKIKNKRESNRSIPGRCFQG